MIDRPQLLAKICTASMRGALADLRLDRLRVLYPGTRDYDLAGRVRVLPLASLAEGDPRVLTAGR